MADTAVVFVHGLGGKPVTTWGSFRDLIRSDSALKNYDPVFIGYPTSLWRLPFSRKSLTVQTLADGIRTELDLRGGSYKHIILICHSLGGLVVRRYLIDEVKRQAALRVRGLLLYAVPSNGASLAAVGSLISWHHNQLRQLTRNSDLVRDLAKDWSVLHLDAKVKVRYVVGGLDRVVTEESSRSSWGELNVDVISDKGHINLVKPTTQTDLSYLVLRKFVLSLAQPVVPEATDVIEKYAISPHAKSRAETAKQQGYRVIAFDLDGTLLRGLDFSWTVVWKYLGFAEPVFKGAMRDYLKSKTTYQQWCEIAVAHFRAKNLRRSDFSKIKAGLTVTNNFESTLEALKTAGFTLAIISGGIDTFIEEMIPHAAQFFDYICVNRLEFEQPSGLIKGVDATPFDFAGKTAALQAICQRHGCTLEQAVFVGEGFNDEDVVNRAGLSIAYPPGETAIDAASNAIPEDDLSKILSLVL
jgi:HAD superfamily phosphoserine phosphatase-like hydrolase